MFAGRMFSRAFPVFLAAFLFGFSAHAAETAAPLIANGDFERDGKAAGWPEGWGSRTPGNGKSWESENGDHFIRLVSRQPGQLQVLYRDVSLTPGKTPGLALAVRYRTKGVRPSSDARLVCLFKDRAGRLLSRVPPLILAPEAADWTEAGRQIRVPESAARLIVIAGLMPAATGTVEFTNISATPLDEAAARSLAAPAEAPAANSLLANGDFETAAAGGGWPAGWGKPADGMEWKTERDKHFVRLTSQRPGQMLTLHRTIPLDPEVRGIELAIRFRAAGVRFGEHEWLDARTIVHFLGADGSPLPNEGKNLDLVFTHKPEATDWIERARFLEVPEGAVRLQLMPGLFMAAAGTVDLAEIRVMPLAGPDVDVLKLANAAHAIWKAEADGELERRAVAAIEAQFASTGNLVSNGNFAAPGRGAGWPDAWGREPPPGASWESENGKRFVRLAAQGPGKTAMLYKVVLLPSGLKGVEVSFRYRTANLAKAASPDVARAVLQFLDGFRFGHLENGRRLPPGPEPLIFSAEAAGWTVVSRRYPVPEGATKLQMMPALWQAKTGILDLAEIRVTPLGDAGLAAQADRLK